MLVKLLKKYADIRISRMSGISNSEEIEIISKIDRAIKLYELGYMSFADTITTIK